MQSQVFMFWCGTCLLTSHLACSTWMPKLCAKLSSSCLKTHHCSGNSQVSRKILLSFQFGMFWSLIFIDLRAGLLVTQRPQRGLKKTSSDHSMLGWAWTEIWCWISCRPASEPRCRKMLLVSNVAPGPPGLRAVRKIQRPMTKPRAPLPPEMAMIPSWHNGHETTWELTSSQLTLLHLSKHLSKHLCLWPLATAILGFACRACTTSVATLPSDISSEHGFSAVRMSTLECILLVSFDFLRPCHISAFVQKSHRVVTWKKNQKSPKRAHVFSEKRMQSDLSSLPKEACRKISATRYGIFSFLQDVKKRKTFQTCIRPQVKCEGLPWSIPQSPLRVYVLDWTSQPQERKYQTLAMKAG